MSPLTIECRAILCSINSHCRP